MDLSLYLVTDARQASERGRDVVETVVEAVAGGVSAVQVREKDAAARHVLHLVVALAERLPSRVALFVNDRTDVFLAARSLGAAVAGVQVGQDDLPVADVRRLVGPEARIGLSVATRAQLSAAASSPARVDYVGIGTVRPTRSKPDAPPALGVEGVVRLAASSALPAVAIGGVTADDLPQLRVGGLAGAAVASSVCAAPDPRAAARALRGVWDEVA